MTPPARARYPGYRFPTESISHAVWYFRLPLGLHMVEELLAARHRQLRNRAAVGAKIPPAVRQPERHRLPWGGDKWHLDEVALKIAGMRHWLYRAMDQIGIVLGALVQSRRDKRAAKRLLRRLLKKQSGHHAS
jgi:putative transposase